VCEENCCVRVCGGFMWVCGGEVLGYRQGVMNVLVCDWSKLVQTEMLRKQPAILGFC